MIMGMRAVLPLLLLATPVLAEPQVYRLTPAQREAAIEAGAERPESAALLPEPRLLVEPDSHLPPGSLYADGKTARDRGPHGEVGMVAGTGGTIGAFGTTAVPLGENGMASFAFNIGQGRGLYGPYGGYGGFDGFGPYPGYIGPGFPLSLVPSPRGRVPAR